MRNVLGNNVTLTLFGESHQKCIGAVLDGLPAGIKIDEAFINKMLAKRRPSSLMDTARKEEDKYEIVSGVFNGYTTGSPICLIIPNENVKSGDYSERVIRPSHADYVSEIKYGGFADYRGGGHFSGRLTASIVALGAICLKALNDKGISVGTHILKCGKVEDVPFDKIVSDIKKFDSKDIPVISDIEKDIEKEILAARESLDSIGGVVQTGIDGLPAGVGEPWFSSLEGVLANAMFSIGGVKGIEFGKGFEFAKGYGSDNNDALMFDNGKVVTKTNNNGGINGGISNGMPIIFNLAIKPTPSIGKEQDSVDLANKENVKIQIKGRHDPAIIRRISVAITCLTAIVLCDELTNRYGEDYLK